MLVLKKEDLMRLYSEEILDLITKFHFYQNTILKSCNTIIAHKRSLFILVKKIYGKINNTGIHRCKY